MNIDMSKIITAADKAAAAAAAERERVVADARAYLTNTDWMVVRESETGKEMPADVRKKRIAARAVLSAS